MYIKQQGMGDCLLSELINDLEKIKERHGDITVGVGGEPLDLDLIKVLPISQSEKEVFVNFDYYSIDSIFKTEQ